MNYRRIKSVLSRRDISVKDLCRSINVSEQGLHQMIRKQSMKVEVLERISRVLNLDMAFWFHEEMLDEPLAGIAEPLGFDPSQPGNKEAQQLMASFINLVKDFGIFFSRFK